MCSPCYFLDAAAKLRVFAKSMHPPGMTQSTQRIPEVYESELGSWEPWSFFGMNEYSAEVSP